MMYAYGLYQSSSRSINSGIFSDGMRGVTALAVAAWTTLVIMLLVSGSTDSLGFIAIYWAGEMLDGAALPRPTGRAALLAVLAALGAHADHRRRRRRPSAGREDRQTPGVQPQTGRLPRRRGAGSARGKPPVPVVGRLEDLDGVIDGYDVARVIIAFSRARHQQILDVVRACADRGCASLSCLGCSRY